MLLCITFVSTRCFVSAHLCYSLLRLVVLFLLCPRILKFLSPPVSRTALAAVPVCPAYSPALNLPYRRGPPMVNLA